MRWCVTRQDEQRSPRPHAPQSCAPVQRSSPATETRPRSGSSANPLRRLAPRVRGTAYRRSTSPPAMRSMVENCLCGTTPSAQKHHGPPQSELTDSDRDVPPTRNPQRRPPANVLPVRSVAVAYAGPSARTQPGDASSRPSGDGGRRPSKSSTPSTASTPRERGARRFFVSDQTSDD